MSAREFEKQLEIIGESGLTGKERSEAIKNLIDAHSGKNKVPMDPYFKKYYIKVAFVVFVFALIGGLGYYSLSSIFSSDEVPKEGVAIINLILGTLLGKASDLFELIRNGNKRE